MHFSDIGMGWEPAVLDTKEEFDFIREGQKNFTNSAPYWIGGTTDSDKEQSIWFNFPDYLADNSGSIKCI